MRRRIKKGRNVSLPINTCFPQVLPIPCLLMSLILCLLLLPIPLWSIYSFVLDLFLYNDFPLNVRDILMETGSSFQPSCDSILEAPSGLFAHEEIYREAAERKEEGMAIATYASPRGIILENEERGRNGVGIISNSFVFSRKNKRKERMEGGKLSEGPSAWLIENPPVPCLP